MKKLFLSKTDKKLLGVCGGIAEYFEVDSTVIRAGFILLCCLLGSGIFAYLILALIMPKKED